MLKDLDYGLIARQSLYGIPGGYAAGYLAKGKGEIVQAAATGAGAIVGLAYLQKAQDQLTARSVATQTIYSLPGALAGFKFGKGMWKLPLAGALSVASVMIINRMIMKDEAPKTE